MSGFFCPCFSMDVRNTLHFDILGKPVACSDDRTYAKSTSGPLGNPPTFFPSVDLG